MLAFKDEASHMQEILSESTGDGGCGHTVSLAGGAHLRCTWLGGGAAGLLRWLPGPSAPGTSDSPSPFLLAEELTEGGTDSSPGGWAGRWRDRGPADNSPFPL